jgi:protein-tyrosine phosphatase
MTPTSPRALPLTVQLLSPGDGSITAPLQDHPWPELKQQVIAEIEAISDPKAYPDRGLPRPVQFEWQVIDPSLNHARYDLLISRDENFEQARKICCLTDPRADVPNLLLGERYYWKVIQQRDGAPTGESPVGSFRTHTAPPRWIRVPGISNVRDLGGWAVDAGRRVRQGMLFRSTELNTHIHISPEGERVLLDEIGIRTDLDLRGTADDEDPAPALDPARVTWQPVPLLAYGDIFQPAGAATIRRAFEVLADPQTYPVLIHCWAGADRTGTLAFLVNGLLGVSLDDLAHDYELTSLSPMGLRLHTRNEFQALLNGVSEFGGIHTALQARIESYLLSIGVQPEQLRLLRHLLVETIE